MNIFKFGKIRPIHACYLLSLVGICILLLCIQFTNNHSYKDLTAPNFMVIDDDLRLSPDGVKSINLRKLGSYCEPDCKTLTLYYRLPELKKIPLSCILSTLITGDTADRAKFVRVGMLFFITHIVLQSVKI